MMDPVRTPLGHIFERVGLAHALEVMGGFCPVTGSPLSLEECERQPELRKRIAQWVRGQMVDQQHRARPGLRPGN